tara:strand:- start:407 stop:517 length:111 start_codon:yes stop_codon:yes gene_type:complete
MKQTNNYTCPEGGDFTKLDEWAKPQAACINCGVENE